MSQKAVAAFLSGLGVAMMPAWLLGNTHAEASIYPVSALALILILASFAIDKSRGQK